eukprot:TRINITY_DN1044_c1_g1_i1.p1 TRINITY_DN1044_c1_g1~~TRINITY_DN1044_c1_g1_i1.p1  ORF type:complete len:379 (-),score=114.18 TRINITY_DN1044_c1_g1_i1:123-1259(-)
MKRNVNPKQDDGKITRTLYDSWCHQCKMKHEKIVVCDHFWDEDRSTKCNGRYCMNCCKRHYGDDLNLLESLENWICYRCSDKCVCAACRRVRNGESSQPNKNGGLIQKGKRKRNNNRAKMVEEDELDESEEEFYPTKFEKNLRSRRKNDNTTKKKSVSPKNEIKKNINNNTLSLKNNSPPTSPKKSKMDHPKIDIPEEDLNGNSMFDILLQVSTLESMRGVDNKQNPIVPTPNNIFNNFPPQTNRMNNLAVNLSPIKNFPTSLPINNILPPLSKIMNNNINNDPKKNEQIQKLLKYDSVLSNPLHPSSYSPIIQLRQEVTVLTTELKNMRQDFSKLQRIFESYIQTHEGSHESSPISSSNYDIPHYNIPLDNLQSNNN